MWRLRWSFVLCAGCMGPAFTERGSLLDPPADDDASTMASAAPTMPAAALAVGAPPNVTDASPTSLDAATTAASWGDEASATTPGIDDASPEADLMHSSADAADASDGQSCADSCHITCFLRGLMGSCCTDAGKCACLTWGADGASGVACVP